jgi:hypothetical protein
MAGVPDSLLLEMYYNVFSFVNSLSTQMVFNFLQAFNLPQSVATEMSNWLKANTPYGLVVPAEFRENVVLRQFTEFCNKYNQYAVEIYGEHYDPQTDNINEVFCIAYMMNQMRQIALSAPGVYGELGLRMNGANAELANKDFWKGDYREMMVATDTIPVDFQTMADPQEVLATRRSMTLVPGYTSLYYMTLLWIYELKDSSLSAVWKYINNGYDDGLAARMSLTRTRLSASSSALREEAVEVVRETAEEVSRVARDGTLFNPMFWLAVLGIGAVYVFVKADGIERIGKTFDKRKKS